MSFGPKQMMNLLLAQNDGLTYPWIQKRLFFVFYLFNFAAFCLLTLKFSLWKSTFEPVNEFEWDQYLNIDFSTAFKKDVIQVWIRSPAWTL